MRKLYLLVGIVAVGLIAGYFYLNKDIGKLGGLNLPDRCVPFTQIASRSVKDVVKSAPGKVYSFSVTSSSSAVTYFQLYDRSNTTLPAVGLATPSFSLPIPAMTAGTSPILVSYEFPAPFALTASGITFAISNNFANYNSSGLSNKNFVVNICY